MPVPPPPLPPAPPPPAYGGPPPPPPPAFSQSVDRRDAILTLRPDQELIKSRGKRADSMSIAPYDLGGRPALAKPKQEVSGGSGGRSALLADIQKGARLKKVAQINDRSAPQIDAAKKNNTGNGRGAVAPPTGGLFAGGFPVLKPTGQRDSPVNKGFAQVPGMKNSATKYQDQTPAKPGGNSHSPPELPKPPPASAPPTLAMRVPPPRPSVFGSSPPGPPPIPPSSSKPQLMMPSSSAGPPFKERYAKSTGTSNPPPPPPFQYQAEKSPRSQRRHSQPFPPLPPPPPPFSHHLPPPPPPGYSGRAEEVSSSSPSPYDCSEYIEPLPSGQPSMDYELPDYFPPPPDIRDYPPPPPPPLSQSARRRFSEPFPLPPSFVTEPSNVPPRPPKSSAVKQSLQPPPPPAPLRIHKATPGGKLIPPPPPPARSSSTELSSRQQVSSNRMSGLSNHPLDDFESKFTFHSVEDLPAPEHFEPFERVYPSKCPRAYPGAPPLPPPLRFQMR